MGKAVPTTDHSRISSCPNQPINKICFARLVPLYKKKQSNRRTHIIFGIFSQQLRHYYCEPYVIYNGLSKATWNKQTPKHYHPTHGNDHNWKGGTPFNRFTPRPKRLSSRLEKLTLTVRETGVSWHIEDLIKGPLKPLNTIVL